MGARSNHHYVPQFLLNRFKDPAKDVLHVYDKKTDKVFATNSQKVAVERSFYEIETSWGASTVEPGLAALETMAASIIDQIVTTESLAGVSVEDRVKLAAFISVQLTRTRNLRENVASVNQQLIERFRALGIDPSSVEGFKAFTEEEVKRFSVIFMIKSMEEFTPLLVEKLWLLTRTTERNPLLLSDNPIALHNDREFGPYGNLGLAVPGIEIHVPLSRTLALLLLCPSLEMHFRKGEALYEIARKKGIRMNKRARRGRRTGVQLMNALATGSPVDLNEQNVIRENSLQIRAANRFVFSSNGDFGLVKEMLNKTPSIRTGPRFKLS